MYHTHLLSYKILQNGYQIYSINIIFYNIDFYDVVYNMNGLNNQNKIKMRPQKLRLHNAQCTMQSKTTQLHRS